jgi:hypothetical protein
MDAGGQIPVRSREPTNFLVTVWDCGLVLSAKPDKTPPRREGGFSSLNPGCKPTGPYCLATGSGFGLSESELR